MIDLQTSVATITGIGPTIAQRLNKLAIYTVADLLQHYPSRYENYAEIKKIKDLVPEEQVTVVADIWEISNIYTKSRKVMTRALVNDGTGSLEIIWFYQPFLVKNLKTNMTVQFSGKVKLDRYKLQLVSPAYEIVEKTHQFLSTGRWVPIYPETYGLSSRFLRSKIAALLPQFPTFPDWLPEAIRQEHQLLSLTQAIQLVHFPQTDIDIAKARKRIAFDELTQVQLAALVRKQQWLKGSTTKPIPFETDHIGRFIQSLPFRLTMAQNRVIDEILTDMAKPQAMNRLLEGDVGSGKTVVAALAMYAVHLAGRQSVLMAPTEILAKQHYETLSALLQPLGIIVGLRTGSTAKKKSNQLQDPHVLVGTHALLSESVQFSDLSFVVIDEQHKFGVEQRALLRLKGTKPHVLTMTATPIPRTLALTLYGNLDLSVIDEMPIGRSPVKTFVVPQKKRSDAEKFIEKEIKGKNIQAFVVCPLIDESETYATAKAASVEYERLRSQVFPNLTVGLLHGRMKPKEKETVMAQFRAGEIQVLVATPLVEVGVDIPNATIMVIEAADRFGLAQLHQLRGRVGRGSGQEAYCLLFTELVGQQSIKRLKSMETIHSGLKLAEIDLQYRGAGELFGTLQHGRIEFKVAKLTNSELIAETQLVAQDLFNNYYLKNDPTIVEKVADINKKLVEPN